MCKLRIVALDEQFDLLIAALQALGYLHLEPVSLELPQRRTRLHHMELTADDERRRQSLAEARRDMEELRAVVREMPEPAPADRELLQRRTPAEIRQATAEVLRKVRAIRRRQRNLEQNRRILQRYLRVGRFVPQAEREDADSQVLMFTFPSEERMVGRSLRERLRGIRPGKPRLRLFQTEAGHTVAAVLCRETDASQVRDAAWRAGTLEFRLPAAYRSERFTESLSQVQADLEAMPQRLSELERELEAFRREAGHWAAALDHVCGVEAQRLEAKHNFIAGSLLRVLHAYLPIDKREEVARVTAEATDGRFEIEELPLGPRLEEVPVVLRNPAFAKPFEVMLRLFPPPTYGTFDPTVVNAVGVPVFFGLIVGDVGYGLIILTLAVLMCCLRRRQETMRAMGTIGVYCAISTVLFGVLYGEVFGSLGPLVGLRPFLNREEPAQLLFLLKIAVCIGALHVGLGLALGMINARHVLDRHVFHERLGQLLCLASAAFFGMGLFVSGLWLAVAGASFVLGVLALLCGAGVVGLLEVFSLFSNVLSYSRLMALGVASVVLATVANRIFAKLDYGLAGLLAAVLLHALNVLIAMFSPTIHTLRLHYVEFFTKFYQPDGKGYVPFGNRSGALQ